MPTLKYNKFSEAPYELINYTNIDHAKSIGFKMEKNQVLCTGSPSVAIQMIEYADEYLTNLLKVFARNRKLSHALTTNAILKKHPNQSLEYLPYQRAGIEYMVRMKRCICGDDPGLGKTIMTAGVINETDVKSVLIVCPASLRLNWQQELAKWVFRDNINIEVYSYDSIWRPKLAPTLLKNTYDIMIMDEAHFIKEESSKRSIQCKLLASNIERVIALTGTLVKNRPKDLYNIVKVVKPTLFSDFSSFGKRYCGAFLQEIWLYDKYAKRKLPKRVWNYTGASNEEELNSLLRSTILLRRRKDDALPQLPKKRRQIIELQPKKKGNVENELKKWDNLCEEYGFEQAVKSMEDGAGIVFNEMASARKATAIEKSEVAVEYLKELLETVDKVVVFCHHRDVAKKVFDNLEAYNPVMLIGGMSEKDKDSAVKSFQNDESCRVFIGNIQAAGVGLTLTASSTVIFVETSFVPAEVTQCEDRCARIGATADYILVQYLVLQGSLDVYMCKRVIEKQAIADKILDDEFNDI